MRLVTTRMSHALGLLLLACATDVSWAQSQLQVLYAFHFQHFESTDGCAPDSLLFDASGNLFGTTANGGYSGCDVQERGCGTVFKLSPNPDGTWSETQLHIFTGSPEDGAYPSLPQFDSQGNLWGAAGGGTQGVGILYELSPQPGGNWSYSIAHNFDSGPMTMALIRKVSSSTRTGIFSAMR